ncbi:hypothetical protein BC936DRAFT_141853 [Jimgerdemannia flammicorona]|uniref:RING-type domain-containing protein n=1 Tax=Jimgerdemannia flammicorona TaxID=994334 RepID=A0A433DFP0_9FUNG|nr:hypothetical protein BC936DRAFT_141853 [Jimgerdemannia flammicorona]
MSARLPYNLTREREARERQQELSDLIAARQIQDAWNREAESAKRKLEEQDRILALELTINQMDADSLNRMQNSITEGCPICLERHNTLKAIILCGHIMCDYCFEGYCKKFVKNEQIQCPVCRQLILLSDAIPTNIILEYHNSNK